MKIISKSGVVIAECGIEMASQVLAGLGLKEDQVTLEYSSEESKQIVRQRINQVADSASREGVLSDVLGVVVVGLAQLTVALSKAKTLADVNAAAQPLADIGAAVDSAVKSGALKLPYMVKSGGAQGVLADMTKLSNGVAAVFAAAQTPAK
jgi:hypothetical protein